MTETRVAGRYQPLEVVGRGGEATVLKAVDTRHDRLVALKVRRVPSDGTSQALLAEARVLLSLPPHPGLAHARDDLLEGGRHILVLDWVDGVNLAQLLAGEGRPGLPASSVVRWMAQVASALAVMHQHGVAHGDVKPANLILDATGRVVLVDLGSSSIPTPGTPRGGTPGFRAPEVAAGQPADRVSDVYSLAATAYALLTGTAPGRIPATPGGVAAYALLTGTAPGRIPATPGGVAAGVAGSLDALRAGLAIDPARRPRTPGELIERTRAGSGDRTPAGVVTVLVTDVVDSAALWAQSPEQAPAKLADMQLVVDRAVEDHGGTCSGSMGERGTIISAFANAMDAVNAAVAIQRDLSSRRTALPLRAALATGELADGDRDLRGAAVERAAAVRSAARAGEVLLSASTTGIVRRALPAGVGLVDLGTHRLSGEPAGEAISAVVADGVTSPPDPARPPYPGLVAFGRDDADLFVGREGDVERCLTLFHSERFVAVVGASGSGKTSLVQAGLAPHLGEVAVVRPGVQPLRSLGDAGVAGRADVVLIVDQLEEFVTLCRDPGEQEGFIDAAVAHPGGLIVTMRADLYGELGAFAELASRVASSQVLLGPLSARDVIRAIDEPARRCGLTIEDGLAELVATELGDAPGALPLLGHALREAWERRDGRTITVAGYRASGGVRGAIAATAERALTALDAEDQDVARRALLRMVELRPDGDDARRWASRREITDIDRRRAADVVATLAHFRLLVIDRDQVTIAHEALLRAWPRLAEWISAERGDLVARQELRLATERWAAAGHSDTDLYRGRRLDAASDLLERAEVADEERAYVDAGRQLREREQLAARRSARRLRVLATVASLLAVMALVVGAIALVQRDSARDARSDAETAARAAQIEALVGRAESIRSTQRDVAALLAIEAYRLADTPQARSALLSSVAGDQGYLDTHYLPDTAAEPAVESPYAVRNTEGERVFGPEEPQEPARTGIVLPDGATAYVSGLDGRARPYDLDTGDVGAPLAGLGDDVTPINGGLFAATTDSEHLAHVVPDAVAGRSRAGIYDVVSGDLIAGPFDVGGYAETIAFSPAGDTLFVSMLSDGSVRVFDASSGRQRATLPLPTGAGDAGQVFGHGVGLALANDDTVVIGSAAGVVRIVDADSLDVVGTIDVEPNVTHSLRPAGDGMVVGSGPAGVVLIDVAGRSVTWQVADEPESCWNLAAVPEAGAVFCGDHHGRIDVRDLATGTVRATLDGQNGNTGQLWPTHDGTELVSFANNEPVVSRWRLDRSGPVTRVIAAGSATGAISPNGRMLITRVPLREGRRYNIFYDMDYTLVDLESGGEIVALDGLRAPTWTPDDNLIGGGIGELGPQLARFDVGSQQLAVDGDTITPREMYVGSVDPGKQRGLLVYFGSEPSQADLRAIDGARHVGPTITVDDFTMATISASGHRIAAATRHGVEVFDGATGEELGAIPGDDLRATFITVGDQFFVASLSGELVQYDLDTLEPIQSFGGSRGAIQELYGTTDGSTIAVRGGDGVVTLFDVASGVQVGPAFTMTPDDQLYASLAIDGTTLTYGGGLHSAIRVVDLDPERWVDAACRIAGRNLTAAEWTTYVGDLTEHRPTCPGVPFED